MRLNLYIFISLILHLIVLIFSPIHIKKERLKGEKITPIEIINNESLSSSKGNANKNSPKELTQKLQNNKKKAAKQKTKLKIRKDLKIKDKLENVLGDFPINKQDYNDKTKIKKSYKDTRKQKKVDNQVKKNSDTKAKIQEKKLDIKKITNPKMKGFSDKEKIKERDPEKGSIKGKGNLKITCLNCVSPKYPRKALKKGLEGKPIVKVWILKNGAVDKVELIKSSGIMSIDNAALDAAQRSEFYPLDYDTFMNIEYDLKIK
tara:strand:- start:164 stop:946 length:783 start_codon:yes stop_codon:yes gene_type:complete